MKGKGDEVLEHNSRSGILFHKPELESLYEGTKKDGGTNLKSQHWGGRDRRSPGSFGIYSEAM